MPFSADDTTQPPIDVAAPRRAGLLARLGWGHRGFRVDSPRRALVGLMILLAIPFVADQFAFQNRMRNYEPDLRNWLPNAVDLVRDPRPSFYRDNPFYIYPPFFLLLVWPLTQLPSPAAAAVFETLKWVALVVALRAAWRLAARDGEDVPPIVALGSLALTWRFIDNDLGVGNINLLLLAAVVGALWLVRRRRDVTAGALLAVAASIKVTPALLLAYLVYKGCWRTLIGAAIGLVLCLLVLPALVIGWDANLHLLQGWYDMVVHSYVRSGAVRSERGNQALVAIINRLLGPHPAILPDTHLAFVVLSDAARNALRLIFSGAILAGVFWTCRRRARPRGILLATEAGLVLIATLLVSGLTWKAHCVVLVLPYAALLAYLADARYPRPRRGAIGMLLVASALCCTFTSNVITRAGSLYAEVYGLIALGVLLAGAALVLLRARLAAEVMPALEDGP